MKYAIEMGSGVVIYIPGYLKTGLGIKKLMGGFTDTENTQRYHEIYCVPLPICTVATADKAICKYYRRVFASDSNPNSTFLFLNTRINFNLII
jgi:hypothetical protein